MTSSYVLAMPIHYFISLEDAWGDTFTGHDSITAYELEKDGETIINVIDINKPDKRSELLTK